MGNERAGALAVETLVLRDLVSMETVSLALHAMNTRFELVLHGEQPTVLRAAGEEALREVERIEDLLSAFRNTSEIAHLNALAEQEPVQASAEVVQLLQEARGLSELCDGAFDVTVGPLMRCWGFWGASGCKPSPSDVERARSSVGMSHVRLDEAARTVRFLRAGTTLDLGAIGKGYAIDRAAEILRDNCITSALLHGGTSTVYAIGRPPDQSDWRVAIENPQPTASDGRQWLATVGLCDEAISISAISEKSFDADGTTYGHVMDPRTGWPVPGALLTAVITRTATQADALSTGLMVLGASGLDRLRTAVSDLRGLVVEQDAAGVQVRSQGIELTVPLPSHALNTAPIAASLPVYAG